MKLGLVDPRCGRILRETFKARLDSDYTPHPDLNEASARQLIADAESFVGRMTQLLAEPAENDEVDDAAE